MNETDAYRYFAYLGYFFWISLLLAFINRKFYERYYYKELDKLESQEQRNKYLASRLIFAKQTYSLFKYILYLIRVVMAFLCLLILHQASFGSAMHKNFITSSLMMVCMVIPAYFGIMLIVYVFDSLIGALEKRMGQ
jgi:hypothetical protein